MEDNSTEKKQAATRLVFQHAVDGLAQSVDRRGWSDTPLLEAACAACGGAVQGYVVASRQWKWLTPKDLKETIEKDRLALILYPETKDYHSLPNQQAKMDWARERVERAVDDLELQLDSQLIVTHGFRTGARNDRAGPNALPRLIEVARIYFHSGVLISNSSVSLAELFDHPTFLMEVFTVMLMNKKCRLDVRLFQIFEDARVKLQEMQLGGRNKVAWKTAVLDAICRDTIGDWLRPDDRMWARARALAALLVKLIGCDFYDPELLYSQLVPVLVSTDEVRQNLDSKDVSWYSGPFSEATVSVINEEMKHMLCELGRAITGLTDTEPDPAVREQKELASISIMRASPRTESRNGVTPKTIALPARARPGRGRIQTRAIKPFGVACCFLCAVNFPIISAVNSLEGGTWEHDLVVGLLFLLLWTAREIFPRLQENVVVRSIMIKHWADVCVNLLSDFLSITALVLLITLNYKERVELPLTSSLFAAIVFTRGYLSRERYQGAAEKRMLQRLLRADKLRFGDKGSNASDPYIISAKYTYGGGSTWEVVDNRDGRSFLADWGISCRLADLEARTRVGHFLSGRAPFSHDLFGDILHGWLHKPDLRVNYAVTCHLASKGKLIGGIKGGNGARILKGGATADIVEALNSDRNGVYRIWALEYKPNVGSIINAMAEVVQEAASAEEQILLLEKRIAEM